MILSLILATIILDYSGESLAGSIKLNNASLLVTLLSYLYTSLTNPGIYNAVDNLDPKMKFISYYSGIVIRVRFSYPKKSGIVPSVIHASKAIASIVLGYQNALVEGIYMVFIHW